MAMGALTGEDETENGAERRIPSMLLLCWIALIALFLVIAVAVTVFGKASDGEPSAAFDIGPAKSTATAVLPAHASAKPNINLIGAGPQPTAAMPATAQTPPPPPPNITAPIHAGTALIADPALIEETSNGPLPRIADDGRSPMTAYAPPVPATKALKIAVVVTGLGISAKATAAAIATLPPGVTLAFAPYADDVQRWVNEARQHGHEVLLEVPMEPYDFPDSDPGPHTLRSGTGEDSNVDRLNWSLTRFTGYAGVTNLLGGRFMADTTSLEPVMAYLSRRGLVFFDSGSATRSAAPDIAARIKAPFVQSVTDVDAIQTGMEIDQRLSELEAGARQNGYAAGSAFLYPITMERLAVWAKGLPGRGFVLVPASAIVQPSK